MVNRILQSKQGSNIVNSLLAAIGAAVFLLSGCASQPPLAESPPGVPSAEAEMLRKASMEISYVLGHTLHRFVTTANAELVKAESFRDQKLLKESTIDPGKYQVLMKQAWDLMTQLQSHPVQKPSSPCRTPFTLKIRNEQETKSIDGCRSTDAGAAVGKLIKNAEVLLYSRD
jgi:hypothetical protein